MHYNLPVICILINSVFLIEEACLTAYANPNKINGPNLEKFGILGYSYDEINGNFDNYVVDFN